MGSCGDEGQHNRRRYDFTTFDSKGSILPTLGIEIGLAGTPGKRRGRHSSTARPCVGVPKSFSKGDVSPLVGREVVGPSLTRFHPPPSLQVIAPIFCGERKRIVSLTPT